MIRCRSCFQGHRRCNLLGAVLFCWFIGTGGSRGDEAVHARIDRFVQGKSLGPVAAIAADHEFLRRVYIDLNGRIPSAAQARAFLADEDPEKRAKIIDQLLQSPEFARHMANVFDVMMMERRTGNDVPAAEWQKYLFESMLANKPLNVLAREILEADSTDPAKRVAAKFYLDRQGETNLVTRDVGRVFFGKDFQCAQCHDHPLIDDYVQADYYGIYAFLNRSYLFKDKKDGNKGYFVEKADGDVNYNSVFTKKAGRTGPRLPDDVPVVEPVVKRGEEYVVAPSADARPVPKYSRRAQLAALATSGTNRAFNRNMANRLWAHMLGRGIVEPVDLHHSDNPPSNPELLEFLTDQLAAMKFDIRAFLRAVALSETYQRSYELPADSMTSGSPAVQQLPALEAELVQLKRDAEEARKAATAISKTFDEAEKESLPLAEKVVKLNTTIATVQASTSKSTKAHEDALKAMTDRQAIAKTLEEAAAKTKEAIAKLPEDKDLAAAAEKFQAKAAALVKEVADLAKKADALVASAKAGQDALASAIKEAEPTLKEMDGVQSKLDVLRRQWVEITNRSHTANLKVKHLEARVGDLKLLSQLIDAHAQLATLAANQKSDQDREKLEAEKAVAANSLAEVTQRLSQRFFTSTLRPLSPESLGWSMMQATGTVDQMRVAVEAEVNKKIPLDPKTPLPAAKQAERTLAMEQGVFTKGASAIGPFVSLFGAGDGQPQNDFFATVDQALFLANGGTVRSWLAPAGGNLTARLMKLDDPKTFAEELYISVLTRFPTAFEIEEVTRCLGARPKEKESLVQELTWGLLSSSEFRFNH